MAIALHKIKGFGDSFLLSVGGMVDKKKFSHTSNFIILQSAYSNALNSFPCIAQMVY